MMKSLFKKGYPYYNIFGKPFGWEDRGELDDPVEHTGCNEILRVGVSHEGSFYYCPKCFLKREPKEVQKVIDEYREKKESQKTCIHNWVRRNEKIDIGRGGVINQVGFVCSKCKKYV